MSRRRWHPRGNASSHGRDATLTQVIEAIDRTAPDTKTQLAETVGISEQYLSELLGELKGEGVVRKAYVVDNDQLYDSTQYISRLSAPPCSPSNTAVSDTQPTADAQPGADTSRGPAVVELLKRLDEVTATQYAAAHEAFVGGEPEQTADTLEPLANERYSAVLSELKSYTLTTDWPGNRVAADLSTIATNLEIVGDRACFIADVVDRGHRPATGVIEERVVDVFESGTSINSHLHAILFDCDLTAHEELSRHEKAVHRDLNELFELVTAYDQQLYGYLVTVTRALERAIYYWVHAAEIAVQLHTGVQPDHVSS